MNVLNGTKLYTKLLKWWNFMLLYISLQWKSLKQSRRKGGLKHFFKVLLTFFNYGTHYTFRKSYKTDTVHHDDLSQSKLPRPERTWPAEKPNLPPPPTSPSPLPCKGNHVLLWDSLPCFVLEFYCNLVLPIVLTLYKWNHVHFCSVLHVPFIWD